MPLDLGVDVAARLVDADAVLAAAHAVPHDAVVEDAGARVEAARHDLALDVFVVMVILHTVSYSASAELLRHNYLHNLPMQLTRLLDADHW